ncbi:HlyD family type I secretion periplasmic adaptor subunit [Polycladidibacter stylochi]|uniref:HlyD family type I secretion periplasmic adaptor subunit n=1 Tax=Polycladidibacter stylochi TaxID=1807766 RepID=UPI00082A6ABE|nr:HlyD family type I secretion periplasmic adaptor subunit [Pseudovibrio stylochi]
MANYNNDLRESLRTRPPRKAAMIVYLGLLLIGLAAIWAYFARLEEVTRGDGRVIPSRQIQVVQAPERGIVRAQFAREGDVVDKGQVLVRLEDTGFAAQLGEVQQRHAVLYVRAQRLFAEATGEPLDFTGFKGDQTSQSFRGLVSEARLVFDARKKQLKGEVGLLQAQSKQRDHEHLQLLAEKNKLEASIKLLAREVEINQALFKRKVLPEIEFLRLQRQLSDLQGTLAVTNANILRAESAHLEAQARVDNARQTFVTRAQEELTLTLSELAVTRETLLAAQNRAKRTDLRAPVKGIVNNIKISTIGAVVQPGETIMELVPLEDTLLIEAQIRPQDIAFLRPGQAVTVKITAYDFSIYGGLEGKLERISADTTKDEQGNSFFKVTVRTTKNYLESETKHLPIIPGMVASIDILTGDKTVLEYLLKPINKVRTEALRER